MSRKLLSDPYLAIHGKKMAKNGHFFMEFWPIFDICHRLRPYLCSKREELGFHKQATHMRRSDEPFFYFWVHRTWLGMTKKWSISDQKWPTMCFWPSGTLLGPSGPFWTISEKNDFLPEMDKVGVGRGALEQNINSCLKRSKRVQMGPKGFLMVKNT